MNSLDGSLPDAIEDGEAFTRFLLSKSHFAREKGKALVHAALHLAHAQGPVRLHDGDARA